MAFGNVVAEGYVTNADERLWRAASAASLLFAAALCAAPLRGHSDAIDPHTYTVLARHVAESGRWLDPSYLPSIFHHFREHLPFGIWPWALAVRLLGEGALVPLALTFSLGTLVIMLVVGARVFGRSAALLGVLVLSSTDSFFQTAGQVRLDNLLLLLTTATTLPLWEPVSIPTARWAFAAAMASLAVLVKGPFGLLPLVATTVARAFTLRSPREILFGGLAAGAALLPAVLFLAHDALLADGTWWRGYVLDQLYASARGLRNDSEQGFVPLKSLAGRFWPGLPLSLWGIAIGLRDLMRRRATPVSMVAVHTLAGFALLFLPARKLPHHNLVMYPALALLAGAAAAPVARRLIASLPRRRAAVIALIALAAATTVASVAGVGAFLTSRFCVIPPRLGASLPRGADVLVVAPEYDWRALAALAAEYDLNGWPVRTVSAGVALEGAPGSALVNPGRPVPLALVRADVPPGSHGGWQRRAQDGRWTLWARDPRAFP